MAKWLFLLLWAFRPVSAFALGDAISAGPPAVTAATISPSTASITTCLRVPAAGTDIIVGPCVGGDTLVGNRFSVGTSTFVVKDARVGVGTASPGAALEVNPGDLYLFDGDSNPTLKVGDSNTSNEFGSLQWVSASDRLRINNDAAGAAIDFTETGGIYVYQTTLFNSTVAVRGTGNVPLQITSSSGGDASIQLHDGTATRAELAIDADGNDRFYIYTDAERFSIGSNIRLVGATTVDGSSLTVTGDGEFTQSASGADGPILLLKNSASAANNNTAALAFGTDSGGTATNGARIQARTTNSGDGASELSLWVHEGGGSSVKAVSIGSNNSFTFLGSSVTSNAILLNGTENLRLRDVNQRIYSPVTSQLAIDAGGGEAIRLNSTVNAAAYTPWTYMSSQTIRVSEALKLLAPSGSAAVLRLEADDGEDSDDKNYISATDGGGLVFAANAEAGNGYLFELYPTGIVLSRNGAPVTVVGSSLTVRQTTDGGLGGIGIRRSDGARQWGIGADTTNDALRINDGSSNLFNFFQGAGFTVTPPSGQTIAAGNTITADACGGIKKVNSGGAVTTSTTDTITAPAAHNAGCCMDILNENTANDITLDANSNNNLAADTALGPCDSIRACSTGASGRWFFNAVYAGTCN